MTTDLAEDIEQRASAGDVGAQLALARRCEADGAYEPAIGWLRRATAKGNVEAKANLGRLLLVDIRRDPAEGIQLTMEAAQAGSGEAMHLFAIVDASGRLGPPNWARALMLLQRSAELGYRLAQSELALLAGDTGVMDALSHGENVRPETWDRLRSATDLASWLAVPPVRAVHSRPRVSICENFASHALCDWLIARGRPHLQMARIDNLQVGRPVYSEARNNSSADLDFAQTDVVMHMLRARMRTLAGPTTTAMEGFSLLNYKVGEHCLPHYDFSDPQMPDAMTQVSRFGPRVSTILIYLNDDYGGGETEFPTIGWRYKGRPGDLLFFWNVTEAGEPDLLTLHAGLTPTYGEKWLLSQWVRGRVG